VPGDYAKTLFCIIFSAWAFAEIYLCFTIPEKLLRGSLLRRASFFVAVVFCMVVVIYFVPLIPMSLSYPAEKDCVTVELPVRGTWLARHAGASKITNGHFSSHRYAVDILKLGPDGGIRRGREKAITDFYSYNEPVYSPAAGTVIKVVNGLEKDLVGNYVIIDIGDKKYVVLIHFRNGGITVEEGRSVKTGALIGYIGNSGGVSGILHLHMQIQNSPAFERGGSVTYPFRFRKMMRKRWLFREEVSNGYLLRNDKFSDLGK
jgi:murein DD-endopeptidase MepM/ murein hydrolase activator NlpD